MRWLLSLLFLLPAIAEADTLAVGKGKPFERIEAAYQAAKPGDTIEVYRPSGGRYERTALIVEKPRLRFVGKESGVVLDGKGFSFSGVGRTARAIFQVNPGADGVLIENLILTGAHNDSHNGAGIRINGANGVTIRGCEIHGNDMGVMSNGSHGDPTAGANQLIERCRIHSNGDLSDPGYNHNLYLGGTSVTVRGCEIFGSTTGHNLKSRAHFTVIEYNYIHDAANREIDLVDGWDTERPDSNAVILGNVIVKEHPAAEGNRTMIHFGQDGGAKHDGTLYLAHNTIVSRYVAPIVQLSSPVARAQIDDNVIVNVEQAAPVLIALTKEHQAAAVTGRTNWISAGYKLDGTSIDAKTRFAGKARTDAPPFVDLSQGDFRLPIEWGKPFTPATVRVRDGNGKVGVVKPTEQLAPGGSLQPRPDGRWIDPLIGAGYVG